MRSVTSLSYLVFFTYSTRFDDKVAQFLFDVDRLYRTSHIVVLSRIHHILYLVRLVKTIQYHFTSRTHLYDQSCHCLVWFSSQTVPGQIGSDNLLSISAQTRPIRSVMSLSYLVFVIDCTRFNQSRQLSFNFGVDHICMISHIVILYGFRHSQHSIRLIIKFWYLFQCKWHLYDQSCHYPIWFSSQTTPGPFDHDSSVTFLEQNTPV